MNQTAAAIGNTSSSVIADALSTVTTLHLVLIGLLALLVIAGIIYGVRLKRRRKAAEQAVEEHAIEAGVLPPEDDPAIAPAPMPVAPSPPPIDDMPTVATAPQAMVDEPIAAIQPLVASRAVDAASAPAGSPGPADGPVTQLKGLGPKVTARLGELGITTVGEIAALDDTAAASLDAQLGPFRGRMERDRWIEQARFLAAGDRVGFEAVFGRL